MVRSRKLYDIYLTIAAWVTEKNGDTCITMAILIDN